MLSKATNNSQIKTHISVFVGKFNPFEIKTPEPITPQTTDDDSNIYAMTWGHANRFILKRPPK